MKKSVEYAKKNAKKTILNPKYVQTPTTIQTKTQTQTKKHLTCGDELRAVGADGDAGSVMLANLGVCTAL